MSDNTVYRDDISSPYVTSGTGVDFTAKSTLTNGQGLYTNNKLEDGENMYFRGGSFCAYPDYDSEDDSGGICSAAGGTWDWDKYICSLNTNKLECQSLGYTYYELKNNVSFAGHNWRIIRIDENDNIRMILADDSVSRTAFNTSYDDNAYVGYMYGTVPSTSYENAHTNTNNSIIKTFSDTWYSSNLSSYTSYIADAGYCNDRSLSSGLGYGINQTFYGPYARNGSVSTASPRLACPNTARDLFTTSTSSTGNKALTYPVGLITVDEIRYAGRVSTTGIFAYNFVNYLSFSDKYWTMSPYYASSLVNIYLVNDVGSFGVDMSFYAAVFRPSISLNSNVLVSKGKETIDNPYIIY